MKDLSTNMTVEKIYKIAQKDIQSFTFQVIQHKHKHNNAKKSVLEVKILDVKKFLTKSMLVSMPLICYQLPSKSSMTKIKYTNKTPHTS